MKVDRIYIVGGSGAGKTFMATKLSQKLKIKHYDLDNIVFKKNEFERVSEKIRDKIIKNITNKAKWIIEGAYSKEWIIPIYKKADLVIIIDVHHLILKKRILFRVIKRKLGILKGKKETLKDFIELYNYVNSYKKECLTKHKKFVKQYKNKFIILRSNGEITKFLKEILK